MKSAQPIRIGIVGTGFQAGSHAASFAAIEGVTLSTCHDIVTERARAFGKRYGVNKVVNSLDDVLEESDLIAVVTPDSSHAAIALAALAAGKHLLCEKPLTVSMEEASQLAEAAQLAGRRGQHHAVNFSKRNAPAVQRAMEIARGGRLGEIRHVHGSYLQAWLASRYLGPWTDEWLLWRLCSDMGSAGALADLGAHLLDYTTAIAGEIKALRCTLRSFPKPSAQDRMVSHHEGHALDANDSALIELDLAGGGLASLHTSRWGTGVGNSEKLSVHGTEGALSFDLSQGANCLRTCLGEDRHRNAWTTYDGLPPVPNIQQRLIAAIRGGAAVEPDLLRGVEVQAMLAACQRSDESGKWESCECGT